MASQSKKGKENQEPVTNLPAKRGQKKKMPLTELLNDESSSSSLLISKYIFDLNI